MDEDERLVPRLGYAQPSRLPGVPGGGINAGALDVRRPGHPLSAGVLQGSAGIGGWRDADGRPTYGADIGGAVGRFQLAPGNRTLGGVGVEGSVGSAQAGITANQSTLSMGAQANAFEVGATVPFRTGRDDQSVRAAFSVGAGMGGRLHYGDDDGDGVPEMGFGVDLGLGIAGLGIDVRSETLGRAYNALSRLFGRRNQQ